MSAPQISPSPEPRAFRVWISGPLPGQNEIVDAAKGFGGRGLGYAKLKKAWTTAVASAMRVNQVPRFERLRMDLYWVEARRNRDPDNIAAGVKFICDGMVEAGVLENDGWKQIAGWSNHFTVGKCPGVTVVLTEAGPEA